MFQTKTAEGFRAENGCGLLVFCVISQNCLSKLI